MNREQLKDAYQKIYAWMTILNMHDIFTDDNDKPNYPLIGKVWTNQKSYLSLEQIFYQLYKQEVHKKYGDDPKHIFKILMIAIRPKRKNQGRGKRNDSEVDTINM